MILLLALVLGLAAGWLRGGSLDRLGSTPLRGGRLAVVGAVAAALTGAVPLPRLPAAGLLVLALAAVVAVSWRNRTLPGVGLVVLGMALNVLVVLRNGAMPVASGALDRSGLAGLAPSGRHQLAGPDTSLPWLGDVIGVPAAGVVISVGDLLLLTGIGVLIASLMCRAPEPRGAGPRGAGAPVARRLRRTSPPR